MDSFIPHDGDYIARSPKPSKHSMITWTLTHPEDQMDHHSGFKEQKHRANKGVYRQSWTERHPLVHVTWGWTIGQWTMLGVNNIKHLRNKIWSWYIPHVHFNPACKHCEEANLNFLKTDMTLPWVSSPRLSANERKLQPFALVRPSFLHCILPGRSTKN